MAKMTPERLKKMQEGRKRRRQEIADSRGPKSIVHKVKDHKGGLVEIQNYTRAKAIKTFCSECMPGQNPKTDCTSPTCPLYPYRGKKLL